MMMIKARLYSSIVFALLLIAGAWLSTQEINASVGKTACNCCQGACQGCCCSMPEENDDKNDSNKNNECKCNLSDLPAIPEQPFELIDHHHYNQSGKSLFIIQVPFSNQGQSGDKSRVSGASPPDYLSPPIYVLFASFLI